MKYRLSLAVYVSLPLQGDPFTSLAGATQHSLTECLSPHVGNHGGPIQSWNLTYCLASRDSDRFASRLNPKAGTNTQEIFSHPRGKLAYNLSICSRFRVER